jgi:hypothetical protein
MKKKMIIATFAVVLALAFSIAPVSAKHDAGPKPGTDFNGPHFNLNLVAKNKVMPGGYDNSSRHTMFVPLDTSGMTFDINQPNNLNGNPGTMDGIKIEMTQGPEFAMIDGNATDGYGAFELGPGKYMVYIAVKAKSPKFDDAYTDITGWVEAYDNLGQLWYYIPVGSVNVSKGKNKWTDATDLLFVSDAEDPFDFVNGDDMWVFDYMAGLDVWTTDLYDFSDLAYLWQVDNHGNKLIQVRFYPM